MFQRLTENWVYGGFLMGLMLLVLSPLLVNQWDELSILALLCLPAYAVHQYEEHDADRFRIFVNAQMGGGKEALTIADVFWINTLGVWGYLAIVLWAARVVSSGWAMAAAFLLLVNGLAHITQFATLRRYNPGLASAIVLFIPLSAAMLWIGISSTSSWQLALSLAAALLVHALILVRVKMNLAKA